MKEQIFISYRREGGDITAKLICESLKNHGYTVFYDYDSIRGGFFDQKILEAIEECTDFIVVLPKSALDRCANEGDWVRQEISHAFRHGKNIIPGMLPEFTFPCDLPADIENISRINAVQVIMSYFESVFEAIINRLFSKPKNAPIPSGEEYESENTEYSFDKDLNDCSLKTEKGSESFLSEISFDMRQVRTFASCGNETTVFKIRKSADGQRISLSINFEKTRLRDEIPEYAGAYYLKHPALDITNASRICFQARSEDESIETIWVEIKPEGKEWMHESFDFCISSEFEEYSIDLMDFIYPDTLKCVEEITFVIKPVSFTNSDKLTGTLEISHLYIK